jgi:uncharacterized 2Fe-2S/4Fe-4S cluster protein (DUF4445 family)
MRWSERLRRGRRQREDVLEPTFVGNPVMHHLFLGIDPVELGGAPFALAASDAMMLGARPRRRDAIPGAALHAALHRRPCRRRRRRGPCGGAAQGRGRLTLLVDVGTNAEIVLGNQTGCWPASSPTGPAFEGAEISSGQRAAPGAIERVRDRQGDQGAALQGHRLRANGPTSPTSPRKVDAQGVTGICGSGIIEASPRCAWPGWSTRTASSLGAMADRLGRALRRTGARYLLYVIAEDGPRISVLQTDIRAIQLAKAALYAGAQAADGQARRRQVDRDPPGRRLRQHIIDPSIRDGARA